MKKITSSRLKKWLGACVIALLLLLASITFTDNPYVPSWSQIFSSFGIGRSTDETDFVRFIDVGQGDSILISSNGHNAMIDFGNNSDDGRALYKSLRRYGVTTLDCMFITHYDADHIGGADTLLERCRVYNVILPEGASDTAAYREVKQQLDKTDAAVYTAVTGTVVHIGDFDLTIVGYYPDAAEDNDQSIVVMAEMDGKKFLFSGDAGNKVEARLLEDGLDLDCDVFKASHHGSRTGNSDAFIEAITPDYAVISCGENNTYGHPHEEVLKTFQNAGVTVYRTDESGDITFYVIDGRLVPTAEYE